VFHVADLDDVRRLAAQLPEVTMSDPCSEEQFGCGVRGKGFAWTWMERPDPKRPRVPQPAVLAIRTRGQEGKEELLAADPAKFFTEPHYNGFPAVLVMLAAVDVEELRELLTDAWLVQAPKRLAREHGLLE
jgi:hypothetical protein